MINLNDFFWVRIDMKRMKPYINQLDEYALQNWKRIQKYRYDPRNYFGVQLHEFMLVFGKAPDYFIGQPIPIAGGMLFSSIEEAEKYLDGLEE